MIVNLFKNHLNVPENPITNETQRAEWILNDIEKTFNGTISGSKSMLHGISIHFV